jgi:hypothetical protein
MADRKRLCEVDLPPMAQVDEDDITESKMRRWLWHNDGMTLPDSVELEIHPYYGEPNMPCGWNITVYEQPNTDK